MILSGPLCKLAKSISARTASAGGKQLNVKPISSSLTWPDKPSLQSKKVSPVWIGKGPSKSTRTVGFGPSERVMMFLEI